MPLALIDRDPVVPPERLVDELAPPPRFADVSFDSYVPDPEHPSQAAAVERLTEFAADLAERPRRGLWRRRPPREAGAVYLDGGFGVGKTHLLASVWHRAPSPRLFATFVELTHLVGALGFHAAIERLSGFRLVCVDEFELDDPGDTVLVSNLLTQLAAAGVALAATSNTLPDRLGQDRFAAQDFLREIQSLAQRFEVIRIEGEDYRHRGLPDPPPPLDDAELRARAATSEAVALDDFAALVDHLARVHPSRYGALLDGVESVFWSGVGTLTDQAKALRFVVLADRLYDRSVPVAVSGCGLDEVFAADLLAGGYRKKYFRAISRLVALSRAETA